MGKKNEIRKTVEIMATGMCHEIYFLYIRYIPPMIISNVETSPNAPLSRPRKTLRSVLLVILSVPFFSVCKTGVIKTAYLGVFSKKLKVSKGAVKLLTAFSKSPYMIMPDAEIGLIMLQSQGPLNEIIEITEEIKPHKAKLQNGDETGNIKADRMPVIMGRKMEKLLIR